MQLRLRMIDRSEYPIAAMAAVSAWITATPIGAWLALHPLAAYVAQGLITIALGCGAVIAQHFVRRYLNRNWPHDAKDDQVAPGQALKEAAEAGVALFKYLRPVARPFFNLIRAAILRLRRRKES